MGSAPYIFIWSFRGIVVYAFHSFVYIFLTSPFSANPLLWFRQRAQKMSRRQSRISTSGMTKNGRKPFFLIKIVSFTVEHFTMPFKDLSPCLFLPVLWRLPWIRPLAEIKQEMPQSMSKIRKTQLTWTRTISQVLLPEFKGFVWNEFLIWLSFPMKDEGRDKSNLCSMSLAKQSDRG